MRRLVLVLPVVSSVLLVGCHSHATIATWSTPGMNKPVPGSQPSIAVSRRVAFAPIMGPPEISERLERAISESQPKGSNHLAVVYPAGVKDRSVAASLKTTEGLIKTVSHQTSNPNEAIPQGDAPREMTPMDAARNRGAQLIVHGNIEMADIGDPAEYQPKTLSNPNNPGALIASMNGVQAQAKDERLVVTWEAYDVETGQFINATTVSLTRTQAEKEFPELASYPDPVDRVLTGLSRQTWGQFAPSVGKREVTLNRPYISLGSKKVREGNTFAEEGLWQMAEYQWQAAVTAHPKNKSAWHNLALASVAQEDYEMARLRLSKARSWIPSSQFKKTELWIDGQQLAYHRSFGLPDREGGWLTPEPQPAPLVQDSAPVEPVEIEDLPWWTSIPFTKPPGWTWKAWLKQPLP